MAAARSLAGKVVRRSMQGLLVLLLTLGVLVLSAYGALQTSWGRERLRLVVNDALSQTFQGKILLDRIGSVSLWGVSGVDARIYDPAGRQVIAAHDLRALASLPSLAYEFVAHADRPDIALPLVHIQHVDVALREDAELGVTLAAAFLPRDVEEPEPAPDPTAGPVLRIGRIVIDRIWAHGRASGSPDLDADLLDLRASLSQSPTDGFGLDLARVDLVSRGLPLAANPRGRASGRVELPAEGAGPMHLELALHGRAAESPLTLEAVWVGDDLYAQVGLSRLPAAYLNGVAPGLALDGDVTVLASVDGELPQLDFEAEIDGTGAHVTARGYGVLADGRELSLHMDAARVDLSRIVQGGPESDLRAVVSALLFEQDDGQFVSAQHVVVDASRISGVATPPLWVSGRAELDSDMLVARGQLRAAETGADVNATYAVELPFAGPGGKVGAAVRARLDEPARLSALGVRATGTVEASGQLDLQSQAIAAQASVSLSRVEREELAARNVEAQARASGTLTRPVLKIATTLDALSGRAHADLDYTPERQQLALFVADWDLLRLSRLLGAELPLKQGVLNLDARVEVARGSPPRLDGKAKADFGKVGVVDVTARALELPATAPSVASLQKLRGDLEANGSVDLTELSPYFTAANLPIERSTGRLRFEAAIKGKTAERGLEVSARVVTNALRIVQERKTPDELRTTAQAIDSTPFALEGIDVHLAAHSELESGVVVATLILRDRGGTLAEAQAEARIAELLSPSNGDVASLERLPLRATLQVPERRLQSLPALLRPAALRGRVALDVKLEGSVADPRVEATISGKSLRAAGTHDPVSVDAALKYAEAGGELTLRAVQSRGGVEVARVATRWEGDLRRAGLLAEGSSGITGSTSVTLREFPLDVVPPIVDRQVTGRVNGDFELRDWGRAARVSGRLSSTSLVVGRIPVQRLDVSAETDDEQARAEVEVKVGSGVSKATLDAGVRWGRRPLPELEHRGALKIETHAFKLETLSPLLGAYVSELGGVLDASTQITVTPESTRLAGQARLERGLVQVPAVGQRFSDISARLAVANDEFKLEHLEARGTTGRVTAKGSARLDGFALRSASASVAIAKHEAIPLTIEGAALGDAWGNIQAKLTNPEKGAKRLEIDVQRFHLVTPENGGSGLQSLDEPENVRVGVRRADGKFVPLAVQPLEPGGGEEEPGEPTEPLLITVKLGNDVVVERGRTAQVQLTGQLRIESARETAVTGRIEVRGGKLDVSGKTFDIERGVVTFDGRDPGNPTITATARWDAPEYTVYAEYLGDVENGRIKLRSEPPLSQDEIASLLLFGSPDGSLGAGSSDNASLAVSVAGDTAAKGLNQVLDDFTNLDVSARVDTTTGSARPELVFQVTPRLAAKVTRAVGAPTANESPDRTFLTLELRLKRAWALSAVVGDHGGSALDLIWRRRY